MTSIIQLGPISPVQLDPISPMAGVGDRGGRQLGQVDSVGAGGRFLSGPQYPQSLGVDKGSSAD